MGTATQKYYSISRNAIGMVAAAQLRRRGVVMGMGTRFYGRPIVSRADDSDIVIGRNVTLCSSSHMTALGVGRPVILRTVRAGARVVIGDETGASGVTICSALSVSVGSRCLLGADVLICDTPFHPVDEWEGRRAAAIPDSSADDVVEIADDVFIGARAMVLPGSSIGRGAVIGAGAVVVGDIPPETLAVGNPARVVRRLIGGG